MAKRTLYPLFAAADEQAVRPILDALKGKGFAVDPEHTPNKNDVVLFFLSAHIEEDAPEIDEFLDLDAQKLDVIPINLDGSTPPALIENAIMARNTIFADRYTEEELVARITDALKKPDAIASKLRKGIVAAAAVVLLAVIGIMLWRVLGAKGAKEAEAEATPAPTATPVIPDGIPPEDVERIHELLIIGDQMHYTFGDESWVEEQGLARVGADYYATRGYDENGAHWYSKEDGHEIETAHWDDLSFLRLMTNLSMLTIVRADGQLPDLSNLQNLGNLEVFDCSVSDIEGVSQSGIGHFGFTGDPIDFSPLSDCPALSTVDLQLNLTEAVDLSGFHPPVLSGLSIRNANQTLITVDLSGLGQSSALTELLLERIGIENLQFISDCTALESLSLRYLNLKRLDGVENMKSLKYLDLLDVSYLADISAIAGCTSLEVFRMRGYPEHVTVRDLSALGKLPKLYYLSNVAAWNTDLDFLKELPTKQNVYFIFVDSDVTDYSGFSAIESYYWLYLNMNGKDPAPALRNLQDSSIEILHLRAATNPDLSMASHANVELDLEECDVRDLTTLSGDAGFEYFIIENCPRLQSLDGIEKIKQFGTKQDGAHGILYVEDCPRLTDWSALDGLRLEAFYLVGMDSLPDFSKFSAELYNLEGISGLTDLTCFEGLDPRYAYSFDLSGLDGLTDISTLYKLKGKHLCIRPEWREQAEELVESGVFESYEVKYPDAPWQPNTSEFVLLSLDELETLPKSALARVEELWIAGDTVYDGREYWIQEDWDTDPPTLYLRKNGSNDDERVLIEPGTRLTDLSLLKDLKGIRRLHLRMQPLETLNGIQYLESLEELSVENSGSLSDVSAAFTLQSLTDLTLRSIDVASIDGIQNLYNLERLDLKGLMIDDLTPLLNLRNLQWVMISRDMSAAGASLGNDHDFELRIEE